MNDANHPSYAHIAVCDSGKADHLSSETLKVPTVNLIRSLSLLCAVMTGLIVIIFSSQSMAEDEVFSHQAWQALLQSHVREVRGGQATEVDYAGFSQQRPALKHYLEQLSAVSRSQFDQWPDRDQLAFLINAYNAWTVELILTRYPDLDSIKDLGSLFRSPWKKAFIPLLEDTRSLDDIEHGLIRGSDRYNEPRIHFAVNCASIGCPALGKNAYTGSMLDQQLEMATRLFLMDRTRNRLNGDTLEISSIFKWYRGDFEQGWRNAHSLEAFLAGYGEALELSPVQQQALQQGGIEIDFLRYDWQLNKTGH